MFLIILHSSIMGNTGRHPVSQSTSLSIHLLVFLHDSWMNFLHISYHGSMCGPLMHILSNFGSCLK